MSVRGSTNTESCPRHKCLCSLVLLHIFAFASFVNADPPVLPKLDVPKELLAKIQDNGPLPPAGDVGEQEAFARFVQHARGIPAESLTRHAKANLSVEQLLEADLGRYRGDILHVEGNLISLREIPAGAALEKAGIGRLYEARIVEPSVHALPTTVIFSELPKGLAPGTATNLAIACDGYFFKRHRYKGDDGVERMAGVVISRSVSLREPLPETPIEPARKTPAPPEKEEPNPKMDCPREWLEHIEDDQRVLGLAESSDEYQAYNYFVLHARKFSPELLAKHSNRKLTFRRLFDEGRGEYRGEIVHVAGRLKRLNWIGTNEDLGRDGVKDLYEAWIFDAAYYSNPTCVVISELPPGLKYEDKDIDGVWVECDAYFFKRYRYRTETSVRLAPLAIGRTLTVTKAPVSGEREAISLAYSRWFLPVLAALAAIVIGAFFVMHRWFKRGDRWVRRRLEDQKTVNPFSEQGTLGSVGNRLPEEPSLN